MSELDSLAFEPGQQVQCKTRFEDVFKGEVVAFDLNSKILILKSPSSTGNNANHDLHFLVLDSVSDVEILEEPPENYIKELPSIEMKYVKARQAKALTERIRLVEAVGNGVNRDGIALFSAFSKTYDRSPDDVVWEDKKIVVMSSVIVSPPYKESDCSPLTANSKKDSVVYVRNIVRKYWESCSKQKSVA